jgi:glutathione synthase/RimK-type ligase-like ATP-grasp enzyme
MTRPKEDMILLCGTLEDPVVRFLSGKLESLGARHQLLDLSRYPINHLVTQRSIGDRRFGSISWQSESIRTAELTGVFVRNLSRWNDNLESQSHPELAVALHVERELGLENLFAGLPCLVVNPFRSNWSNQSKPYQTLSLRGGLFKIPKTLITNDATRLREFYEEMGGQVIHKSASSRSFGTNLVTPDNLTSLLSLGNAPVQLQEKVSGVDIRVHVVRDRVFATRIRSNAVDYRRLENGQIHLEAIELPADISAECVRTTQGFGLLFSGIDLRETPDGRYYCFEVNTAPDFAFYERKTGQEISVALRDLLSSDQLLRD